MTQIPTNRTLKVTRAGIDVATGLPAMVTPASAEVIALRDLPAGKAFSVYFRDTVSDIREGDRLYNESDLTEHYRVIGVAQWNARLSFTEVTAEKTLEADMKYDIDIPDLAKLQRAFREAPDLVAREVIDAGNKSLIRFQASARQNAPVDSSQLRGGILVRPMSRRGFSIEGKVDATAKHSIWQEQGTGIYGPSRTPIRPKRAKMLAFTVGGKRFFARQVRGTKPKWFMRDSVRDNTDATKRDFAKATERVVAALGRAI